MNIGLFISRMDYSINEENQFSINELFISQPGFGVNQFVNPYGLYGP